MIALGLFLLSLIIGIVFFRGVKGNNSEDLLVSVNREQLMDIIENSNREAFIYVGRPSCLDCEIFYPELIDILKETNKPIFYFDTTTKASQKPKMKELMESFGIEQIPAIMHTKDGSIIQLYDCQREKDIEQFMVDLEKEEKSDEK